MAFEVHQCPRTHAACRSFSGDPIRIGQVVKNLLLNAIRYTPRGGTVTIDCHRDADHLALVVANEGPGIAAKDLPHIFEPQFRGSATAHEPRTGMGLTVAKRIVEDHGGTIEVHSTEGQGAIITVSLPDATSASACSECPKHVRVLGAVPIS